MHLPIKAGRLLVAITLSIGLLAQAGTAGAVHWPFFGGDSGRSGYQPVDEGAAPVTFLYARTDAPDRDIVTSVITSAGVPANQRVVYGTADGRVHMRTLENGAEVGPAGGTQVSTEPDAFGDGVVGSVTFAETSSAAGLGQVFAVHNGPLGIEIAQIDEATGALVQDVAVAGAEGFSINSSVMLTGAAADTGNRSLFFVGENDGTGVQALFRVPITAAATTGAAIGAATKTGDINANPEASPTLVFLAAGAPYLAVGTLDGKLLTFKAADLTPGPTATLGGATDVVQTPSVPVTASGLTPGATGSGAERAPFIYAARGTDPVSNATVVHKVVVSGAVTGTLDSTASTALAGSPAPALATDQEVTDGVPDEGSVLVTTESNLYALRTSDLTVSAKLSATDSLLGGLTGFSATTAAATGDLVVVARDSGEQLVLSSSTLQPLPADQFTQSSANTGSSSSIGQPSISRRFLQFATDKGLFVYRMAAAPVPPAFPPADGYRMVAADGGIFTYGNRTFFGSTGDIRLARPIVSGASKPTSGQPYRGYWIVAADGGIFAYGEAGFFGSAPERGISTNTVVAMAPHPDGNGYWIVTAEGKVTAFGSAKEHGSVSQTLNKPIVAMTATPSGNGYWLLGGDGGIFTYGDAGFFGSTGDLTLNQPVVDLEATPDGKGYWLAAGDGGVFTFGEAEFKGSTGDIKLNRPVVALLSTPDGSGYWMAASDGGVFSFEAPFLGSTGDITLNAPVLDMID